jgi:hypothetical protein
MALNFLKKKDKLPVEENGNSSDQTEQSKTTSPIGENPDGVTSPTGTGKQFGDAITLVELEKAIATLRDYKDGKTNLESKIVENERWFKLRHWDIIRKGQAQNVTDSTLLRPEPTSAWLFSSLVNKHADAMDNYPEANVLPREQDDEVDAKSLSSILPVIMEHNEFEQTYSDAWWYKLKHGGCCYGVFWNKDLENGIGDIDIRKLDLLNIFWESGVTDIQKSRNIFIVDLKDNDLLEAEYPQLKGKIGGNVIDVKQYIYDDTVDVSDKSVVVDWYYKIRNENGKTLLHYCKFVGNNILFASENDPAYAETGWYEHGLYPIVIDPLFPAEGSPVGFGYLDIMKDPQIYIDKLNQVMMENALMVIKPRYFGNENCGINEDEFIDWSKPIVHVQGNIDDERLKPIVVPTLSGNYMNLLQMKIDEMKETSSNRDFSQGDSASGVTAAAAIAALQEAGNKTSRDTIASSYRSFTKINYICIELIRQFYDETRSFRVTGNDGKYQFEQFNNSNIKDQVMPPAYQGQDQEPDYEPITRRPIFDIVIKAQKKNPFSRASQNELAKEMYGAGFFQPEQAQASSIAVDMMDFEGKDKVLEKIQEGQTLTMVIQQQQQELQQMAAIIQATGREEELGAKARHHSHPTSRQQAASDRREEGRLSEAGREWFCKGLKTTRASGCAGQGR